MLTIAWSNKENPHGFLLLALFQQNTAWMNLCMSYVASDQLVSPPESQCLQTSVQFVYYKE